MMLLQAIFVLYLVAVASAFVGIGLSPRPFYDFFHYYPCGHRVWAEVPPYAPLVTQDVRNIASMAPYHGIELPPEMRCANHPPMFLIYSLLSLLPFTPAWWILWVFSISTVSACAFFTARALGRSWA